FYTANDRVARAQGEFFQAGSEVARLEQQLQFLRDSRARVEAQLAQVDADFRQCESQLAQSNTSREAWRATVAQATGGVERLTARASAQNELLPQAEARLRAAQDAVRSARDDLARCEQERQVQQTRCEHADKLLEQLEARAARLD